MGKLKREEYKAALEPMQRELVNLARWADVTGARIVVLFEGRDTAGKGGAIGAIREHLNPRQCRVVALGKPNEREAGEWYFQRYIRHLLFKYWLCCDQEKQEERFAERRDEPLKGWKLSPIDLKAREQYDEYTAAREAMLEATHTGNAPWTLVDFNDQKLGRLTLIRDLLDRVPDKTVKDFEI